MSVVFTKEGFRALRVAWAILGISIATTAVLGWGSHVYVQKEKHDGLASQRLLQEARTRVDNAKRERDDLKASAKIFQDLVNRGILQPERRLDFIERLDRLKDRYRILGLDYEIGAQRPLPLAGGRVFNSIDVLASRVKLRVMALHEGDALAFLEDLAAPERGFNPASDCTLRKVEVVSAASLAPRAEAQCFVEWISLKDKKGNGAG